MEEVAWQRLKKTYDKPWPKSPFSEAKERTHAAKCALVGYCSNETLGEGNSLVIDESAASRCLSFILCRILDSLQSKEMIDCQLASLAIEYSGADTH